MKKLLVWLFFTLGIFGGVFGAAYWGQRAAIESSTKLDAVHIPLIRNGRECFMHEEWSCVAVSQDMIARLLAARLSALREQSLIDESVAQTVDEYLAWYESFSMSRSVSGGIDRCRRTIGDTSCYL